MSQQIIDQGEYLGFQIGQNLKHKLGKGRLEIASCEGFVVHQLQIKSRKYLSKSEARAAISFC